MRKKGKTKLPEPRNSGQQAIDELDLGEADETSEQGDDFFARQQENFDTTANGEVLLFTRGLKKVYDGRTVVNGVDIEVRRGEIVGLLGPNGAGKTTSFYMIVGLVQPNDGKVFFEGLDTTNEPMFKRARLGMGYLPQEESIFRKLTVRENILAVMETQNYTPEEREMQCQQLMEKFGIDHVADNLALTLSGGEKRRLTIARSLVTEPKLIMLDEPFSGVDPSGGGGHPEDHPHA